MMAFRQSNAQSRNDASFEKICGLYFRKFYFSKKGKLTDKNNEDCLT